MFENSSKVRLWSKLHDKTHKMILEQFYKMASRMIKRIQKIINFGAPVVSGKRRFDHVSRVVRRLVWLSAEQLIEYHTVCMVRNVLVTGQPEAMLCAVGPPSNQRRSHVTRRATQRSLPRIRRAAGRRRLCYRGVKLLNAAKSPIADQQLRRNFKRELLSREAASEWTCRIECVKIVCRVIAIGDDVCMFFY